MESVRQRSFARDSWRKKGSYKWQENGSCEGRTYDETRVETREGKEVQNAMMERLSAPLDTFSETTENLTVEVHDGK